MCCVDYINSYFRISSLTENPLYIRSLHGGGCRARRATELEYSRLKGESESRSMPTSHGPKPSKTRLLRSAHGQRPRDDIGKQVLENLEMRWMGASKSIDPLKYTKQRIENWIGRSQSQQRRTTH